MNLTVGTEHLHLPGGRELDYTIRTSPRSKYIRLRLTPREGLVVTAPKGISRKQLVQTVSEKSDWILNKLEKLEELRHLLAGQVIERPEAMHLPAVGESWRMEYRKTGANIVAARVDRPGRIIVSGATGDIKQCHAALRRWLARRAREAFEPWLQSLAGETGLKYSKLTIRSQKTRWGSCSAKKNISLNCKLLFLPRDVVRYVLVHELCHTMELNHSTRFWALVRQFETKTDQHHGYIRDAWKQIPAWAHPIHYFGDAL